MRQQAPAERRARPPRPASELEKIERTSHLRWVPIAEMRPCEHAQRAYSESHAAEYANAFDLEGFGYPVVNYRDGHWWIIDGQHRVAALRMMGWGDQQIECEAYVDLSPQMEAELFLKRNKRRAVRAFDAFRVAVQAGREVQCDINRIVLVQDLKVSDEMWDGCVSAVTALEAIYAKGGAGVLARTLGIARDSWAKDRQAFRGDVLRGLGMVCARYDGKLDQSAAVSKLARTPGGVLGLIGKAKTQQRTTGRTIADCVAATVVDIINAGAKGSGRLESWWT